MSNKIYTEEQVKQSFEFGKTLEPFDSFEDFINSLTPIELPSDEDIKNWAKKQSGLDPIGAEEYGRIRGAKWMRGKIQGGNNEL